MALIATFIYILIGTVCGDQIWYDNMHSMSQWTIREPVTSSTSRKHCARADCVCLSHNAMIQYDDISTLNHHHIQLRYSVKVVNFENADTCTVSYSIDQMNWTELKQYDFTDNTVKYTQIIDLNEDADNQTSISIKFENDASSNDFCYVDEVYLFGTVRSGSPTQYPTIDPSFTPTNKPTINPTKHPSIDPTNKPTNNPTIYPTINPTMISSTTATVATYYHVIDEQEHGMDEILTSRMQSDGGKEYRTKLSASVLSDSYLLTHWYYLVGLGIALLTLLCAALCFLFKKNRPKTTHSSARDDVKIQIPQISQISSPSTQMSQMSASSLTQLTEYTDSPTTPFGFTERTLQQNRRSTDIPYVMQINQSIYDMTHSIEREDDEDEDVHDSDDLYEIMDDKHKETEGQTMTGVTEHNMESGA